MPETTEIRELTRKRGGVNHKLTNFVKHVVPIYNTFKINPSLDDEVSSELQNRLDKLEIIYNEFEGIQLEIESLSPDDVLEGHYEERDEFTDKYNKYYAITKKMLNANVGDQILNNKSRSRSCSSSTIESRILETVGQYLNNLQQRHKWKNPKQPITIGTLVLLKSEPLPPAHWLVGKVVPLHPGTDDITRVVSVKTNKDQLRNASKRHPFVQATQIFEIDDIWNR
ncbi:hypothetical protein ILUMI_21130 [Ignelater luminosus]|uniref:DUF5641 domain-containing protein n=1 Tax=Ignelater luminosus TaxID=2038154 RepID=A0A8K0G3Y5_IGNLU|nr:hypothetical protein ILUMI_21130 [Ignelater luminosus]